jgi:2-iminoacetate synthase ThiH
MAIHAQEREIELVVTWICNWHCDYCCVDTHNRPTLTMDEVKAKLDKVIPGYNVTPVSYTQLRAHETLS